MEHDCSTSKNACPPQVEPRLDHKLHAMHEFLTNIDLVNIDNLSRTFKREKDAFLAISSIFANFCTEIKLSSRKYCTQDLDNDKISAKSMTIASLGMGASDTWRGAPDARLRGFHLPEDIDRSSVVGEVDEVAVMDRSSVVGEVDEVAVMYGRSKALHSADPDNSNGTSTICEAKLQIQKGHKPQLVKMCVVAAFIEHNVHPSLNSMIPSIIIDTCQAQVALYCAESDVLMISKKFSWRRGNNFDINGIFMLWAMINHRYV